MIAKRRFLPSAVGAALATLAARSIPSFAQTPATAGTLGTIRAVTLPARTFGNATNPIRRIPGFALATMPLQQGTKIET